MTDEIHELRKTAADHSGCKELISWHTNCERLAEESRKSQTIATDLLAELTTCQGVIALKQAEINHLQNQNERINNVLSQRNLQPAIGDLQTELITCQGELVLKQAEINKLQNQLINGQNSQSTVDNLRNELTACQESLNLK